jgi:hypothetical protein
VRVSVRLRVSGRRWLAATPVRSHVHVHGSTLPASSLRPVFPRVRALDSAPGLLCTRVGSSSEAVRADSCVGTRADRGRCETAAEAEVGTADEEVVVVAVLTPPRADRPRIVFLSFASSTVYSTFTAVNMIQVLNDATGR